MSGTFDDKLADTFGLNDEDKREESEQTTNETPQSEDASTTTSDAETATPAQPAKPDKGKKGADVAGAEPNTQQSGGDANLRGAAQRFHGNWQRAQRDLERTSRELETTRAELEGLRTAAQLPTQLGLAPNEAIMGMQMIAHFKRDPVGAAKEVLAQVLAAGINIEELVGSINASAMQTMLDNTVRPLTEAQQRQQQEAETQRAVQEAVEREREAVLARFPWAAVHDEEVADIMDAFEGAGHDISYREAVLELQAYALQNNLNLSQPLRPQLAARRGARQPASNARGPVRTNAPTTMEPRRAALSADAPSRDIVREAMREAGLTPPE
jgi:acetolactate synthase small subunit